MYLCLKNLTLILDIISFSSLLQILFNFSHSACTIIFCLNSAYIVLVIDICKRMDKPSISLGKYWFKYPRLNIAIHEIRQGRNSKLKHCKIFSLISSDKSTEPDKLFDRCLICRCFWIKLCGTWTV